MLSALRKLILKKHFRIINRGEQKQYIYICMCAQVHSHKNKYEKLSLHCEPFAYTLNGWKQQKQQHKFHLRLLPPITVARARDQSATRLPPLSFSLFLQLPHFVTVDEIYIFHFVLYDLLLLQSRLLVCVSLLLWLLPLLVLVLVHRLRHDILKI